jgi:drug/metabolite transporter (DMT)-like permease
MTNKFPNYAYFLNQATSFAYIPVFWGIVVYTRIFTSFITPEMLAFPKYKFFVMGALDALAGLFMLFGGTKTSGSTQALLLQAVIPFTMILSYIALKERYKKLQYIGATVILGGVAFVLVPKSLSSDSSGEENNFLFNMIFLMSNLPTAMSSVYKQIAFNQDLDVNFLQAWVALWQVVFGFALAPVNSLKFLGSAYVPIDEIPNAMWNGMKCLAGINTIVTNCGSSDFPCDDCVGSWIPLTEYLAFNMLYNVAIVLVIKYAGANLLYFIMTLRLPLVQIVFSIRFINDPPDSFKWYSIVGLLFIISGLIAYRYSSTRKAKEADEGSKDEGTFLFAAIGPLTGEIPAQLTRIQFHPHTESIIRQRADPQRIRSGLYGRLGIRASPDLSLLRDSFHPSSPSVATSPTSP